MAHVAQVSHKTVAICRREGQIWRSEGRRQAQSVVISEVPIAMVAARIWPIKYEELKRDVRIGRSLGWPSSPMSEDPEMIAKRMPTPRSMRAIIYIATIMYVSI